MRHRVVHRAGVFLAGLGLVALAASLRCANVDRGLGDACERNEDCLSGVCAGQMCVPQPPVRTSFPSTDAALPVDASADGGDAVASSSTTTTSSAATSSGSGGATAGPMARSRTGGHPTTADRTRQPRGTPARTAPPRRMERRRRTP